MQQINSHIWQCFNISDGLIDGGKGGGVSYSKSTFSYGDVLTYLVGGAQWVG